MILTHYLADLKGHDASIALALLELVRRADDSGSLDRGTWLAAVRSGYAARLSADHDSQALLEGSSATDAPEEDDSYLDDHVLARLHADGIAHGEPTGAAWERVRLERALWEEIAGQREEAEALLEQAVGNLLHTPDRQAAGNGAAHHPLPDGSRLAARGLVKVYRKRRVVANVDVDVSQGEIVGLLGPNGAGKTTTFYMIVGLIGPDAGQVFLDERELTRVPMYRRARAGIGYLAQEPSIFRKLTVEENILAILEMMPLKRAQRKQRLEQLLDELGLKHLRTAKAYSLSGGERRRLEITRALVAEPKFMLLDEPFAGVDPIAVHDIQQIVANLR
ncbi:MAG TPA: LPS export ABC transporter ATP-binding protein, partial [Longimicrobiales bacterium]|nr:LPS export ABC transporter ATP-binding protein [Longimicrobiales bacterium]